MVAGIVMTGEHVNIVAMLTRNGTGGYIMKKNNQ